MSRPRRKGVERRIRSLLPDRQAEPAAGAQAALEQQVEELTRQVDSLQVQVTALEQELDLTRLDPVRWPIAHYVANRGLSVQAGPFAGLTFPQDVVGRPERSDSLAAKLIGSYERELHPALERALEQHPSVFVNVGAGDGFYPVGVAMRLPQAAVHAFEIDSGRQATCAALAALNGVTERVEVHGECEPSWLAGLPADAFLLVDCEGCEATVLDPELAPPLRSATLIVELHDFITPESSARVVERFSATHAIERVQTEARHVDDFPDLEFLGPKQREIAVSEFRFRPMEWALLTPR